jgi:hypothetical protein
MYSIAGGVYRSSFLGKLPETPAFTNKAPVILQFRPDKIHRNSAQDSIRPPADDIRYLSDSKAGYVF